MALMVPSGKKLMVVSLVYVHPVKPTEEKNHTMILLVKKRKPEWQRGHWNGPGGEVGENESIAEAASRELREETGLRIEPGKWDVVATMEGKAFTVVFVKYHYPRGEFAPTLSPLDETDAASRGLEFFQWFPVEDLPRERIYDLGWLVPFSLDGRFFAPIFTVRPEVEHNRQKPDVKPCIGGKETDLVTVPCTLKIGGKPVATGHATTHRNAFLPTTVQPLNQSGALAESFPPFVPLCPPVVPLPLESDLPDTVLLDSLPTPDEVAAMKEAIRAVEFASPDFELRDYHAGRAEVLPPAPVVEPEPVKPAEPGETFPPAEYGGSD